MRSQERKLKVVVVVVGELLKEQCLEILLRSFFKLYIYVILYCIYRLFLNKKLEVYFEGMVKYVKYCSQTEKMKVEIDSLFSNKEVMVILIRVVKDCLKMRY